jgi:hypothetical protein
MGLTAEVRSTETNSRDLLRTEYACLCLRLLRSLVLCKSGIDARPEVSLCMGSRRYSLEQTLDGTSTPVMKC